MKNLIKKKYIKLLTKLEYATIDIAGFFNFLQRKLKSHRWNIEDC